MSAKRSLIRNIKREKSPLLLNKQLEPSSCSFVIPKSEPLDDETLVTEAAEIANVPVLTDVADVVDVADVPIVADLADADLADDDYVPTVADLAEADLAYVADIADEADDVDEIDEADEAGPSPKRKRLKSSTEDMMDLLFTEMEKYPILYKIGNFKKKLPTFADETLETWKKLVKTVQEEYPNAEEEELGMYWCNCRFTYLFRQQQNPNGKYKRWYGKLKYLDNLPKLKPNLERDPVLLEIIVEQIKHFPELYQLPKCAFTRGSIPKHVEISWKVLLKLCAEKDSELTEKEVLRIWSNALHRQKKRDAGKEKRTLHYDRNYEKNLMSFMYKETQLGEKAEQGILNILINEVQRYPSLWEAGPDNFLTVKGLAFHQKEAWYKITQKVQEDYPICDESDLRLKWSNLFRLDKYKTKEWKKKLAFMENVEPNALNNYVAQVVENYPEIYCLNGSVFARYLTKCVTTSRSFHGAFTPEMVDSWNRFLEDINEMYPEVSSEGLARLWSNMLRNHSKGSISLPFLDNLDQEQKRSVAYSKVERYNQIKETLLDEVRKFPPLHSLSNRHFGKNLNLKGDALKAWKNVVKGVQKTFDDVTSEQLAVMWKTFLTNMSEQEVNTTKWIGKVEFLAQVRNRWERTLKRTKDEEEWEGKEEMTKALIEEVKQYRSFWPVRRMILCPGKLPSHQENAWTKISKTLQKKFPDATDKRLRYAWHDLFCHGSSNVRNKWKELMAFRENETKDSLNNFVLKKAQKYHELTKESHFRSLRRADGILQSDNKDLWKRFYNDICKDYPEVTSGDLCHIWARIQKNAYEARKRAKKRGWNGDMNVKIEDEDDYEDYPSVSRESMESTSGGRENSLSSVSSVATSDDEGTS